MPASVLESTLTVRADPAGQPCQPEMLKQSIQFLSRLFRKKDQPREINFSAIERILNYSFVNKSLLTQSFKHRSYLSITRESSLESNERLEFLGDAILELVVTEFLYRKFPEHDEGYLSKVKSVLVSRKVLAEIVIRKGLGRYLLLDRGEEKTGGKTRGSNLANLYEAVIGAIYLDSGLAPAARLIEQTLLTRHHALIKDEKFINYKSILLEYVQGNKESEAGEIRLPVYELLRQTGPDHDRQFVMQVSIPGGLNALGEGKSKKVAEQRSAQNLLSKVAPELL
jgi:ribonuclease-3